MIAPSPDWFIGVSGISLRNEDAWVRSLEVDLLPFDAGTDSGPTYVSANSDTQPPEPIAQVSSADLQNGTPFGVFRFERLDAPLVPAQPALRLGNERFSVEATFSSATSSGVGVPRALADDSGAFWFFAPQNLEIFVKVIDGCALTGSYWVFASGLTDVGVKLSVRDLQTGAVREYENLQGVAFEAIQDTSAFSSCP